MCVITNWDSCEQIITESEMENEEPRYFYLLRLERMQILFYILKIDWKFKYEP